jgi:hypothetical protein
MINISEKDELSIPFANRTTRSISYTHGNIINPSWWRWAVGAGRL